MSDPNLLALVAAGFVLLLAMLKAAWNYVFPPRCEKCGRRYNHKAHEQCPYCVPLSKPTVIAYAFPFFLSLAFVGLGLLLSDGVIIGCGAALLFAIVVSTQLRIPWDEVLSIRVWVIALLCFGIVAGTAAIFQG